MLASGGPIVTAHVWYAMTPPAFRDNVSSVSVSASQIDELTGFLAEDPVRNCSLIEFVRRNPVRSIERAGMSVLVRGHSDHTWVYISSAAPDELELLAGRLTDGDDRFAVIEEWMLPILVRGRETAWSLPMVRFVLPAAAALPDAVAEVAALTPDDAAHIYEHSNYREYISIDYARDCIRGGPSVGIREDGVLVAWAMTQDDGAMGFLHVLDGFRHKGFGRSLTIALAAELRVQRKLPFAYIDARNAAAISLVTSLGFVRDRNVQWFQLEKR